MNLNRIFVLGRVTADPQPRTMPSGQSVLSLGVATNRTWTKDGEKQEEVEFHNVVLFGKQADIAAQYLRKGSLALFEGRNQTRSWRDKDGNEHRITEIVCENLQLGPAPAKEAKAPVLKPKTGKTELAEEEIVPLDDPDEVTGRSLTPLFEEEQEIKLEDIPF
jgi:single-strand DNA-binding protein